MDEDQDVQYDGFPFCCGADVVNINDMMAKLEIPVSADLDMLCEAGTCAECDEKRKKRTKEKKAPTKKEIEAVQSAIKEMGNSTVLAITSSRTQYVMEDIFKELGMTPILTFKSNHANYPLHLWCLVHNKVDT